MFICFLFFDFFNYTFISFDGDYFLWPLKLLTKNGAENEWYKSAMAVAEQARLNWVNFTTNKISSRYESEIAEDEFPVPPLPQQDFSCILRASLSDKVIDSLDHPLAKKIRGAM